MRRCSKLGDKELCRIIIKRVYHFVRWLKAVSPTVGLVHTHTTLDALLGVWSAGMGTYGHVPIHIQKILAAVLFIIIKCMSIVKQIINCSIFLQLQ